MTKPSTPAGDADGPKTETTLTTRIRINIPGSRPIPPVVVRKPVASGEPERDARAAAEPPPPAPAPAAPVAAAPAPAAEPAAEPASNWFAPRKAAPPAAAAGPGPGAAAPAAPAAAQPPARPGLPTRPSAGYPQGGPAGRPGGAPAPVPAPAATYGAGSDGFAPPGPGPRGPGVGSGGPGFPSGGPGVGAGPHGAGPQGYGAGPDGFAPPAPGAGFGPQGGHAPGGPTTGPVTGTMPVNPPRDDDTAGFTPSWPGPEVDGGEATTALPVVPPPGPRPVPTQVRPAPEPELLVPAGAKPAPKAAPAKKKGRSKLVLLVGAVIVLAGVAYGAGLLLNHSDVPKGTTVLGVDISGTRDEAVAKLQNAFGERSAAPVQLKVGDKQVELKPDKAGLTLDAQATVRGAAGSDYNPVTVIGSLLGQERAATAVMPFDDEKLQVALQELAGTAGSASEGTIKFEPNKAVAVPGKAGSTLDVAASAEKVKEAFKTQVETGKAEPVELPVTNREPTVDQAEIDRAMREFATPAMSGNATVKAGAKSIAFGPGKSLPKVLSMKAVDGKLVEKYDLDALKELYGNTFDGILIERGNGEKTAVTPQDVAGALGKALRGKTPAERTVVIDTNPS
ncbi:hypothetical protein [Streptomyces sp. NPDC090022]|uniref:hypothetical protein n=1 Tax=Streptomyces sp. NPDC090022 TaxID=3365920 RepID=UPI0037FD5801